MFGRVSSRLCSKALCFTTKPNITFCRFYTMKLYTDQYNPYTLRVLVADKFAGTQLPIEHVSRNENPKVSPFVKGAKLPVLEIEDDRHIFSPNAICWYLLKSGCTNVSSDLNVLSVNDHWMEWDVTHLQPSVMPYLVTLFKSGDISDVQRKPVAHCLTHIESSLKDTTYLAGNEISLADVVVWGTLYPVLAEETNCIGLDIPSKHPKLMCWFDNLMSKQEFFSSVQNCTKGKGVTTFKDSLLAQYAMNPVVLPKKECSRSEAFSITENDETSNQKCEVDEKEIRESFSAWNTQVIPERRILEHPILPKDGEKNILVTSALPYVNNVPHLGNIIGSVLSADVYARFCRIRQYNTLYICGTDEYGTASETKALEEGLTPQEICNKYFKIHSEVYEWFNIKFDYFGRTTTEEQTKISQDIFWKNYQNKLTLEETVEQLHCGSCKMFLADRFVEGTCPLCGFHDARGDQCDACGKLINAVELKSPRCKVCSKTPAIKNSKHLFLDLTELQPRLSEWVGKASTQGKWSANSQHITKAWLQEGLKPRCITRDLKWGTPVPLEGYTDKVFYVWFDAPIGYLSITANYTDQWEKWWKNPENVNLAQFMAKDNVPFHTVVFPSTLIGTSEPCTMLNDISATEYLNYEDGKFSKSRCVGVFGNDAKDTNIPPDIWRFYLLLIRPETQDSVFNWSDFATRNNNELLNNLGNFVNRALVFLENNFSKTIPEIELNDEDKKLIALINRELKQYIELMELIKLRDGLKVVLNISKLGNQFIQMNQPWVLVKGNENDRKRAGSVIGLASNLTGLLSVLLHPFMPAVSEEIRRQLQMSDKNFVVMEKFSPCLKVGHVIGVPKPLFEKLSPDQMEEFRQRYSGTQQSRNPQVDQQLEEKVKVLEQDIAKQGDVVRQVKTNKADKDVISAEVTKLLDLKKKLSQITGTGLKTDDKGKKKKKSKK